MKLNAVELAAWIIIAKAVSQIVFGRMKERHQELEKDAVEAEYSSTQSEERRRRLEVRYPQYLISAPDFRYFKDAQETLDRLRPLGSFRRKVSEWAGSAFAAMAVFATLAACIGIAGVLLWKGIVYVNPGLKDVLGSAWERLFR